MPPLPTCRHAAAGPAALPGAWRPAKGHPPPHGVRVAGAPGGRQRGRLPPGARRFASGASPEQPATHAITPLQCPAAAWQSIHSRCIVGVRSAVPPPTPHAVLTPYSQQQPPLPPPLLPLLPAGASQPLGRKPRVGGRGHPAQALWQLCGGGGALRPCLLCRVCPGGTLLLLCSLATRQPASQTDRQAAWQPGRQLFVFGSKAVRQRGGQVGECQLRPVLDSHPMPLH
jgi:hypothetical protein